MPRDDSLLDWAMQVMKYHGDRKAVLEVSASLMISTILIDIFLSELKVSIWISFFSLSLRSICVLTSCVSCRLSLLFRVLVCAV